MSAIKVAGRYLDQPRLVKKFSDKVSPILTLAAVGIVAHDTYKTPPEKREKRLVQNGLTMFGAVASSLLAPHITFRLFKTAPKVVSLKELEKTNTKLVNDFLSQNQVNSKTREALNKIKTKILRPKEVKTLSEGLNTKEGEKLLHSLIPEPENITSRDIFSEIGRLSVFGLIPVLGGIAGGIAGDWLTCSNYKQRIPNKIKEGAYQYLANIFLCNIGAGAALGILEKMNIKSKSVRALGMITGILITGVIGGSSIANLIGRKVINRCFKDYNPSERGRKPEPLDICLHTDDIATVAVMSGLRWIEPALPALYAISGYRAGIGYRGKQDKKEVRHPEALSKNLV